MRSFLGLALVAPHILAHTIAPSRHLCPRHDAPHTDDVVGIAGEEGLAVGAPAKRDGLRLTAALASDALVQLGPQLVHLALLLQVKDDDAGGGRGAEPVAVWREDQGVDLVTSGERVQVLGLVQVPQHGGAVLATRRAERSIGGDRDGVDVASVADVISLDLASSELPNLSSCQFSFSTSSCKPTAQSGAKSGNGDVVVSWPKRTLK